MAQCMECKRDLTSDEIGLHKKMINRGAEKFLCIDCLAAFFHCEKPLLEQKIEQFREQGCMLFEPRTSGTNTK